MVGKHHRFIARQVGDKVELIRDFDGMYKVIADPRGQAASAVNLAHDLYIATLVRIANCDIPPAAKPVIRYLDVGCGLGFLTMRVANALRRDGWLVQAPGTDIAPSAAERAKKRFGAEVKFSVSSLLEETVSAKHGQHEIVTCFETLYYFEDKEIVGVTKNLSTMVAQGGLPAVSYHLPETMGYGRYVQGLADLRRLLPGFRPRWEMDFTDMFSTIYDGSAFGRHLFAVFQKDRA